MPLDSDAGAKVIDFGPVVRVTDGADASDVLIVCEHASNWIPAELDFLGLTDEARQSHIAWDPGALGVAQSMAQTLGAGLVASEISRLVYDCNRPPEAESAVPETSEIYEILGNKSLSARDRAARVAEIYVPFHRAVAEQIAVHRSTLRALATVHSFTPIYHGMPRAVELGVLHGRDDRLAQAMIRTQPVQSGYDIQLNAPYAARDGVTHTLDRHGGESGLPTVMIEVRNDLIATEAQQVQMGCLLADWLATALAEGGI